MRLAYNNSAKPNFVNPAVYEDECPAKSDFPLAKAHSKHRYGGEHYHGYTGSHSFSLHHAIQVPDKPLGELRTWHGLVRV